MPTQPRILLTTLTALPALALGACFDPMVEPDDGTDSATEGSTTDPDPTGSTTATDPDDTGTPADSTGPGDAPPVITAFTINSSTMPAELQTSGMVAFDVDAMDDVGIDRIEIYDGEVLVATVTEIPWVTELLLTSADNGSHLYRAVAVDTAGQTAESEAVPLSVNVEGGAILEIREDITDFRVNYAISSIPRVVIDPSNEVTIVTAVREDVPMDPVYGLSAIAYTDTLSLVWSDTRWPSQLGPHITYTNAGRPVYDATSSSWVTGVGMFGNPARDRAVASIDPAAEAITLDILGPSSELFLSPIALDSTGAVIHAPAPGELQKLSALDGKPVWTIPIEDMTVFNDILVAPDDTIIVIAAGIDGCPPDGSHCVYKLSADGDILWSRTGPTSSTALTLGVAISPDGHVALAGSSDGPARLVIYDENGALLLDQLLTEQPIHDVRDMTYDAQGTLVLAGERRIDFGDREAWAGRFDEQGNPIWFHVYPFDSERGITGLATNATGKLFAVGWEDRFDLDLFGWSSSGWIAELAL